MRLIAIDDVKAMIRRWIDAYPEDVFPTDGQSIDCHSAAMGRWMGRRLLEEIDIKAPVGDDLERALTVLVTTPHIVNYLTRQDPRALTQARAALDPNGPGLCPNCRRRHWSFYGCHLGTCRECGQGPAYVYAYEHKSTCGWWADYGDHND